MLLVNGADDDFNCWFTRSDSEKHWKTSIELRTCVENNCAI